MQLFETGAKKKGYQEFDIVEASDCKSEMGGVSQTQETYGGNDTRALKLKKMGSGGEVNMTR